MQKKFEKPGKARKAQVMAVEEEKKPEAFFDCKEDKEGTFRQIFVEEQKNANSKCMLLLKAKIGKSPEGNHTAIFRTTSDGLLLMQDGKAAPRVVVPESLRKYVLQTYHNSQLAGHQGRKRTLQQVAAPFYWPGMSQDAKGGARVPCMCKAQDVIAGRVSRCQTSDISGPSSSNGYLGPFGGVR